MACGTPAVSTPVGVMREILDAGPAEAPGLLADFDAETLATAIGTALEDDARRLDMGRRAVVVASGFEYAKTIRAYADGLKSVAGEAA
jgi:glycosyltransferase involved in cell wall biosynthesis